MSKSDIYKDYELTNFSYFNTPCSKNQLDEMFSMIEALEGETLEQKFRTYFVSKLNISNKEIDTFRDKMLGTDEEVTGIFDKPNSLKGPETVDFIYNLSGQRISASSVLTKGINIKGGKKILMP